MINRYFAQLGSIINKIEVKMIIEIEIPDHLPEGRRASFKKGITDILIGSATAKTRLDYTPDGHEEYREKGREVGRALDAKIQIAYPK